MISKETPFPLGSYDKTSFEDMSLTGEIIKSKDFEECLFRNCSLINCVLEKCRLVNCKFEGCVLSAVNPMNSYISDVAFVRCKVIGCDWTRTAQIMGLEFDDCQLNYSNFSMLKLRKMKMVKCECCEVDFTGTDLSEGSFNGTNFERSIFSKTNLTRASLLGAINYSIDPRNNTLKKARFSYPEVLALLYCLDITVE